MDGKGGRNNLYLPNPRGFVCFPDEVEDEGKTIFGSKLNEWCMYIL